MPGSLRVPPDPLNPYPDDRYCGSGRTDRRRDRVGTGDDHVGVAVDEMPAARLTLSRPKITLPSSNPDEAQIIESDIAVVAVSDVPKQDRLAGLSGACAKAHGPATARQQLSNQSPVMCQLGTSAIRDPFADSTYLFLRPATGRRRGGACGRRDLALRMT